MNRIYIACLAAYNNGILHGEWIDITDVDQVQDEINSMLEKSPIPNAEEWAIHDSDFDGVNIGEYESIEYLCEINDLIEEHGQLFIEVLNNFGGSTSEAINCITNNYIGCYESLADYAYEITENEGIPDHIIKYVDFEKMGREYAYDLIEISNDDGLHLFHNC
tara:strand:- start:26 stop:514 length:489 start_codon:yes stop_codon:yes gene_type:complete